MVLAFCTAFRSKKRVHSLTGPDAMAAGSVQSFT